SLASLKAGRRGDDQRLDIVVCIQSKPNANSELRALGGFVTAERHRTASSDVVCRSVSLVVLHVAARPYPRRCGRPLPQRSASRPGAYLVRLNACSRLREAAVLYLWPGAAGSRVGYDANVSSTKAVMEIDPLSPVPLHEQVAAALRRAIAQGEAKSGERLPPARDLAAGLRGYPHTRPPGRPGPRGGPPGGFPPP